jgi:uncharacterized cupin superfamily protein
MSASTESKSIFGAPSYVNPKEWIPLDYEHKRGTTSPGRQVAGECCFLRTKGSGSHTLLVGLWRSYAGAPGCDPETGGVYLPWEATWGDEQVYIVEGTETITNLETGEVHHFKPGDIFSMSKGVDLDIQVDGPYFKKYFCIAHSEPSGLDTDSIPLQTF